MLKTVTSKQSGFRHLALVIGEVSSGLDSKPWIPALKETTLVPLWQRAVDRYLFTISVDTLASLNYGRCWFNSLLYLKGSQTLPPSYKGLLRASCSQLFLLKLLSFSHGRIKWVSGQRQRAYRSKYHFISYRLSTHLQEDRLGPISASVNIW